MNSNICVVEFECLLPGSKNKDEFWKNIVESKTQITEIEDSRLNKKVHYSKKYKKEKFSTNFAGQILFSEFNLIKKEIGGKNISRLEAYIEYVLNLINKRYAFNNDRKKIGIIVGCMSPDESISEHLFQKDTYEKVHNKKYEKDFSVFQTKFMKKIKDKFNIRGPTFFVDSACSSSLSAIYLSELYLKNKICDEIICIGVESNLSPESFVTFQEAGVLSTDFCYPFSKKRKGLVQGEGCGILILKREESVSKNERIFGYIKTEGNSDGNRSALFSPNQSSQIELLTKIYQNKIIPNYIECHGTGTKIGDSIEKESIQKVFANKKIPIGSVKAIIGHTKGSAGIAGLIKSLLIIKNKTIPPSKYIEENNENIFINKEKIKLKNEINIGVSSFGFGGSNFHTLLSNHKIEFKDNDENNDCFLIDNKYFKLEEVEKLIKDYNIIGVKNADQIQLLALCTVNKLIQENNLFNIDINKTAVISASKLGLRKLIDLSFIVRYNEIDNPKVGTIKEKFSQLDEYYSYGVLNNVISGRICNYNNFRGINFNIDNDFNGNGTSFEIANNLIKNGNYEFIIIINCLENKEEKSVIFEGVEISLISNLDFVKNNSCNIKKEITEVIRNEN